MKLDSESAPNAFFHPLGGHSDEWYSNKKFHDPKPTPKDRPIRELGVISLEGEVSPSPKDEVVRKVK